ncbi:LADA_0F04192g1_1 [Lachancea dasiensis]|uniref:LADA_0F04192g1_1 n=1 Tax=Lachancea dasiensis TaxID=1072105 RepID=A0A1G4JJ15_9SACH|nr:LADA_0F04192g1_1 [Lachancea dasiensis]
MISEKAATALATIGTVCWCVQLIPQIIYNYRRKDCEGLPPVMLLLWVVSGIPFAIYFMVTKGNIILQVQPHLFMFFCGVSYVQSLYYPPVQWDKRKIIMAVAAIALIDVGMEIGFTLWLRPLYARGVHWPSLIFGILASVLLALGLIPPYFELAKRQGRVVGINFVFLFVDSLGAWLSIASVIVGNMDIMGIVLYGVVAALEIGIFASHIVWCCRFRWSKKRNGLSDPEYIASEPEKSKCLSIDIHDESLGASDHNRE